MKNLKYSILLAIVALFSLATTVFAAEEREEYINGYPFICYYDDNGEQLGCMEKGAVAPIGEYDPDEVEGEKKQVSLVFIPEINTPDEWKEAVESYNFYAFYVVLVNEDTGDIWEEWLNHENGYRRNLFLPYGNYFVSTAGVKNDINNVFELQAGQHFTVNENSKSQQITLYFKGENEATLHIHSNKIKTNISLYHDAKQIDYKLDSSNNYEITEKITLGNYNISVLYSPDYQVESNLGKSFFADGGDVIDFSVYPVGQAPEKNTEPEHTDNQLKEENGGKEPYNPDGTEKTTEDNKEVNVIPPTIQEPVKETSHTVLIIVVIVCALALAAIFGVIVYKRKIDE